MKNIIKFLTLASALILIFTSCKNETPAETEISVTSETTEPEADHSLVRSFTINEIFENLYAGGVNFSFPFKYSDFEEYGSLSECTLEGDTIIFPDNASYISAAFSSSEEVGEPISSVLRAEYGLAPQDFSAYGIKFGMSLNDLQANYGFPDTVEGDPKNDLGTFVYEGAGTQKFCIEFTQGIITAMEFIS